MNRNLYYHAIVQGLVSAGVVGGQIFKGIVKAFNFSEYVHLKTFQKLDPRSLRVYNAEKELVKITHHFFRA